MEAKPQCKGRPAAIGRVLQRRVKISRSGQLEVHQRPDWNHNEKIQRKANPIPAHSPDERWQKYVNAQAKVERPQNYGDVCDPCSQIILCGGIGKHHDRNNRGKYAKTSRPKAENSICCIAHLNF
jgi:hypothetical protein